MTLGLAALVSARQQLEILTELLRLARHKVRVIVAAREDEAAFDQGDDHVRELVRRYRPARLVTRQHGRERGFQNIRVLFDIDADVDAATKQELVAMGEKYSPVFDIMTNGMPVTCRLGESVTQAAA